MDLNSRNTKFSGLFMKNELTWGGNRENKQREPIPVFEYRKLFPKFSWAFINDISKMDRVANAYRAMKHPLTQNFVKFVLKNYTPSHKRRFLLILPCSKAKPYSLSPSYLSLYRPLIYLFLGRDIHDKKCPVDVLTISGIIGPVPLELEEYSPAPNYDFSLNSIIGVVESKNLFELLAQRIAEYLSRTFSLYNEVYSLVDNAYRIVIEQAFNQIQILDKSALKKLHNVSITSSDLPELVKVMIQLKNKLYPNFEIPQETRNRHYFETLKKRLKTASRIICESDSRVLC
jgi:predicted RNA-binding protein